MSWESTTCRKLHGETDITDLNDAISAKSSCGDIHQSKCVKPSVICKYLKLLESTERVDIIAFAYNVQTLSKLMYQIYKEHTHIHWCLDLMCTINEKAVWFI